MTDETPLEHERRLKVARWREEGREPYPWNFPGRVPTEVVRTRAATLSSGMEAESETVRVAGRLRAFRVHGRTAFADIDDLSGALQLILRADVLGEATYQSWLSDLDSGDVVGAEGAPALSRRGEPSLVVRQVHLLAKAIAPPPEKFHGLQDVEERLRRRYLDLLSSAETRQRFRVRSLLTRETRAFFEESGFLEVETSVLVPLAGGAAAEPFVTHSNYLAQDVQLRIALELPLKRLIVGGLERVFELAKCFRNEDLDTIHSPEFTMLEAYWAYADYLDMLGLTERLYQRLSALAATLLPDVREAQEAAREFAAGPSRVDFVDELERVSGITGVLDKTPDQLRDLARAAGSTVPSDSPPGVFLDKLFEHYVEPTLDRPTFVLDHPISTTPLAKRHRRLPGRVERFEFYYRGFELGNAYSELTDPDEQERRFQEQVDARAEYRYAYDADFIRALRHGMPPTTGIGIGIDRMVMALTGTPSIKDVLLFPLVRST
ncbi:MAG TPA: lysine--tRNA ligase [Thermoplasmata archaeon]|nr:lysine--tRNA ligase [Thermoplasmata archaeon]